MFAYCENNPIDSHDFDGKLCTFSIAITDGPINNPNGNPYAFVVHSENESSQGKARRKKEVSYSKEGLTATYYASLSHLDVSAGDAELEADVGKAYAKAGISKNYIGGELGVEAISTGLSFEIFGVTININFACGASASLKFTSEGFKLGACPGAGGSIEISWDD